MTDLTKALAVGRDDTRRFSVALIDLGKAYRNALAADVDVVSAMWMNLSMDCAKVSNDLIPRADADLAVALMVEKAATITEAAKELAEYASYAEIVGGLTVNRPQVREWCDKVFGAIRALPEDENYERSFRALAPASALSELQELRDSDAESKGNLAHALHQLGQAKAELATLRAQVERLTGALTRQGDNMAFVANHFTLPDAYYDKFIRELGEDRAALTEGAAP